MIDKMEKDPEARLALKNDLEDLKEKFDEWASQSERQPTSDSPDAEKMLRLYVQLPNFVIGPVHGASPNISKNLNEIL